MAPNAPPTVQVLNRTLGAQPASLSQLLCPDGICAEAFVDHGDGLCVPRQMASILKRDFGEVCTELDGLKGENMEGYSAATVIAYAKEHGLGYCFVFNNEVLDSSQGTRPYLCFAVHEGHAYFYDSLRACRCLLAKRKGGAKPAGAPAEAANPRIKREARETTVPDAGEWEEWSGEVKPGHYFVPEDQLPEVRRQLMAGGRHPKVPA